MAASIFDEILRAADVLPIWKENYAGICAAKGVAQTYLLRTETHGFSNDMWGSVAFFDAPGERYKRPKPQIM